MPSQCHNQLIRFAICYLQQLRSMQFQGNMMHFVNAIYRSIEINLLKISRRKRERERKKEEKPAETKWRKSTVEALSQWYVYLFILSGSMDQRSLIAFNLEHLNTISMFRSVSAYNRNISGKMPNNKSWIVMQFHTRSHLSLSLKINWIIPAGILWFFMESQTYNETIFPLWFDATNWCKWTCFFLHQIFQQMTRICLSSVFLALFLFVSIFY